MKKSNFNYLLSSFICLNFLFMLSQIPFVNLIINTERDLASIYKISCEPTFTKNHLSHLFREDLQKVQIS